MENILVDRYINKLGLFINKIPNMVFKNISRIFVNTFFLFRIRFISFRREDIRVSIPSSLNDRVYTV